MHPEELDLSALAGEIAGRLARAHPERDVTVVIEPGLHVTGDPVLLRVVMEHLLENAWKFTAPHPTARVEVGAGPVELHRKTFYVRDDGVGFDPALADQLFQPLRRLHGGEFTGSGIGLATVQRILRRHGGRAWATAEPDAGATFWFTIGRPVVV